MGQKLNYSSDELILREEVEKEKNQSFSTLMLPFTAPHLLPGQYVVIHRILCDLQEQKKVKQ